MNELVSLKTPNITETLVTYNNVIHTGYTRATYRSGNVSVMFVSDYSVNLAGFRLEVVYVPEDYRSMYCLATIRIA